MSLVNSKKIISVVVPVYNEQECLMELYERTSETMLTRRQKNVMRVRIS